ncbi:MAG TPA: antibiotic biosynthesis monooxygenase [Dehalococcoidia bacterium]|nr:antibiotic biosynthesis monooxygenase [Dehalococcoidia bacterium]
MIAVIFQVEPRNGRAQEYLDLAAGLRGDLEQIDGFISVERFESVYNPGKFVSISFWRDEAAILRWREHLGHQQAQARGRGELFAGYRISVAQIVRDYGREDGDRAEAPGAVTATWGDASAL